MRQDKTILITFSCKCVSKSIALSVNTPKQFVDCVQLLSFILKSHNLNLSNMVWHANRQLNWEYVALKVGHSYILNHQSHIHNNFQFQSGQ